MEKNESLQGSGEEEGGVQSVRWSGEGEGEIEKKPVTTSFIAMTTDACNISVIRVSFMSSELKTSAHIYFFSPLHQDIAA